MTGASLNMLLAGAAAAFTALLFANAARHKISDWDALTGFVADYRVMPPGGVPLTCKIVIGAEIAVPASLLFREWRQYGAILAIGLLTVYAAAIALNLLRGRTYIDCGCGGATRPLAWSLVARNAILAGIAALVLLSSGNDPPLSAVFIGIAVALMTWAAFVTVEQVLHNQARIRVILGAR
jgi:hypothetical protein